MSLTIERVDIDDPRFDAFLQVAGRAYITSELHTPEGRERFRAELRAEGPVPETAFYVAQAGGEVVGGMRLYDFVMRVRSNECPVGGLGFLCVDLPYKKRGYARAMVRDFLDRYRERGAVMAALYPFRPDFYRALGFGYGRKLDVYRFSPLDLPDDSQPHVYRLLRPGDEQQLIACYDRTFARSNGLMRKYPSTVKRHLASRLFTIAGYIRDGELAGYVMYSTAQREPDNFNLNELTVEELIYDDTGALRALLSFLRRQGDQFSTIEFNTQLDGLEWMLRDPRSQSRGVAYRPAWHECNTQALGIMYRSLGNTALLERCSGRDFGIGECTVAFEVADAIVPTNAGTTTVRFAGGWAEVTDAHPDVTVQLDVAEYSSLIMGAARLRTLVTYGGVRVSEYAWLDTVDAVLATAEPPRSTTWF